MEIRHADLQIEVEDANGRRIPVIDDANRIG